ncbi:dihydrodipicolinate synthase family protein [Yangia mangrovi]|uniref:Dihydrodipicolinate synthase family protein n=1 Tax=Alloyangia mangrovi TaxID=1779329 RepID=A0A2A3JV11_9RHOB|nr:dihydrodipicolinate synthase family protein [Alloyangia mangrovi]MCT4369181.1 dihydrodipicolinate synthase family protein [Alloyangia mangrovi]
MRAGTDFKGVVGAAVTPVTPALEIDVPRLISHCDAMLRAGCAFTSAFGTTGEGASFSADQKIAALQAMKDAGHDMSRQVPGIIAAAVEDAARLYRACADLGCRAALIIPPFYYTPSSEAAVAEFYAAVAEKAGNPGLDIVLYNFPHFSGVTFTPALVREVQAKLGELVIGIKDSTGNLEGGLELIRAFPELSIFTGDDRILTRMVAAGGAGMIGGLVNLFPADSVTLCGGKVDAAFEKRAAMRIEAVDAHGGLVVLKALVAARYGDDGYRRTVPPLAPLEAGLSARLAEELGFTGATL